MKKFLTLILSLSLILGSVFSFAGCNKDKDENTLTCGVTIIPGLNEKDANGNWIGFESEFAMAVGEILGMSTSADFRYAKRMPWRGYAEKIRVP